MNKKCFIAGLPSAGKTTFLAALMYLVKTDDFDTKLKLKMIKDIQYLASLSEKWADATELDRTITTNEHADISINLELPDKSIIDLFLPDLSGETFQNLYEFRQISKELSNYIIDADTFLFFINVKSVKDLGLISEAFTTVCEQQIPTAVPETLQASEKPLTKRNPKEDPLQIQIIQLLQFFIFLRKNLKIKIGFMFSAWDVMKTNCGNIKPDQFLKERMNMLWQFCVANSGYLEFTTWGISAQGGELEQKDLLLDNNFPYERINVEDNGKYKGHDLTLPLYLLLGGLDE